MEAQKLHTLIKKCLDNEQRARRQLYEYIAPIMLGISYRYAQNKVDADDIFQEGIMNFFHRLYQLRDIERMEGWAKSIIINEAIRFYKKKRNLTYSENIETKSQHLVSNESIFIQLETEQVLQMIRELPDKMRMVINLYAIEGYKHEEIAEMLGISVGTSKSNLFDARKQIRKRIENESKRIG